MTTNAITWARPVAAAMGWHAAPTEHGNTDTAYLCSPDGLRLHIRLGGYRNEGRAAISWSVADELRHDRAYQPDAHKSITVAADKPAVRAAADISRRLLPGLAEMTAELTAKRARRVADEQAQVDYLAHVATLVRTRRNGDRVDFDRYLGNSRYAYYGSVEYRAGYSTATLKLALSPEDMLAVVEFVAQRFVQTDGQENDHDG